MTGKQISIIAIVAATSFMGTFLISSVNIALPAIEKEFGLNAVGLSWVVTAFLLAAAIFLLPVGRYGDLTGIRRLFKAGVVLFTVSSLLCALAPSSGWLIAFRFLQGMGASLTTTTGAPILVSSFLPQQRGRVLGMSVSAVYMGLAAGPFIGGILTQHFDWRVLFYTASVLGLIIAVIAFRYLGKDSPSHAADKKISLKGSFFYMTGLVALVYGSSLIPSLTGWLLMAGGVSGLIVFWIIESRSDCPVIETRMLTHNRLFAFSNMAALINYSATYSIIFLLSLYLQKIHRMSPREAGTLLIAQPVMMALFSPLAGRLSDRIPARYLATAGMTMCTMGLAAFAFLSETTPQWWIIILLVWVGLGFALFSSPNMNTIMSSVDRSQYGIASGTAATMRILGQITSMTIATLFFAAFIGSQAIETVAAGRFMKAVQFAFGIFAIISAAGIYFSYKRGKQKQSESERADRLRTRTSSIEE